MTTIDVLFGGSVTALLTIWFALSILNQIHSIDLAIVKKRDIFSLIPKWTFFAPNPATSDYHLLIRDLYSDGTVSSWQEVALGRNPNLCRAIWNPDKRLRKVLIDTMRAFARLQRRRRALLDSRLLRLSMNYILLLDFVSALPAPPMTRRRQFAVIRISGFFPSEPARVVLTSEFHSLC